LRSKTTELSRRRLRPTVLPPLVLLALVACGGEDLLLPSSGQPARITAVSGNGQTGTVGQPLPQALVVEVTDPEDRPVQNVEVTFVAPAGAVLVPNDTVVTGADGRASVHYTLATAAGEQTIEARARPVVPSLSLTTTFRASAEPESAVQLVAAGGDQQEGEVQTALAESLAVSAVDRFGNGVAGVEVVWEATDGTVSPASVATGVDGRAATQRTLGARPGRYRTTASAAGLEGSPVEFEAIGVAPPSPQLMLVTQPSTSAAAGVPFERQPVLQLHDAVGAPLPRADVAVTVQITEGEGSLSGTTTARSNAEGRVGFTDLSIRGRPGDRTLLFAASDFTPATSDKIEVNPGPPDPGQSSASASDGTAGEPTSIAIRVKDEFGTEILGATGAIRVRVEGANPGELSVTDEGNGNYSARYTPTRSGTDQIDVQVNGTAVGGSPLSSVVQAGPADAASTTALVSRRPQIFWWTIDVTVTSRDSHGNLTGRGGALVQVDNGTQQPVQDKGDGTYVASFNTFFPDQPVTITLNGVPIAGSPYTPR
jgi:hypothetical protein